MFVHPPRFLSLGDTRLFGHHRDAGEWSHPSEARSFGRFGWDHSDLTLPNAELPVPPTSRFPQFQNSKLSRTLRKFMSHFSLPFPIMSWTAPTHKNQEFININNCSHGVCAAEPQQHQGEVSHPLSLLRAPVRSGQDVGNAEDDSANKQSTTKNPRPSQFYNPPQIHGIPMGCWLSCSCPSKSINLRGFGGKCHKHTHTHKIVSCNSKK